MLKSVTIRRQTGHAFQKEALPAMKLGLLSGYDALVTFPPVADLVAGTFNPIYGEFHGNLERTFP